MREILMGPRVFFSKPTFEVISEPPRLVEEIGET